MIVGNEDISTEEAISLVRMLVDDARQFAGVFHGENRSPKFRADWPNEYVFAESEWRHFVEAVLLLYAQALNDPYRSEYDKRRIYLATLLWQEVSAEASEHYAGEQMLPGTEKFEGSKSENIRITGMFGRHAMTFAELALPSKRFH